MLLQELDKLSDNDAVLVVATCNDTKCLGDALLRPGRFDRQIMVSLPEEQTRKKIFKFYFSKVSLVCDVDLAYAAKITYGRSGADIECIVNEAAILTLNSGRKVITFEDVRFVINKMIFDGRPDKPLVDGSEAMKVAVHEAGHTIVALELLPDGLHGASIIPQGTSCGHVDFFHDERSQKSVNEAEDEIAVALAGRVAEREILKKIYMGSAFDMRKAASVAMNLVTNQVAYQYKFVLKSIGGFDDNVLSEQSKYELECKLDELLTNADKVATEIILGQKELFDKIVEKLIEKQIVSREELLKLKEEVA